MKRLKEIPKDNWKNFDAHYLKYEFLRDGSEGVNHPSRAKIRELLKQLRPKRVLEVGSGPAVEYEGFKQAGLSFDYVGVDVTKKMVFAAHELFPEAWLVAGDAECLPFKETSFDVVFTRSVLEHQSYYERQLREMFRVASRALVLCFFKPPWHRPDAIHFDDWHNASAYAGNHNTRKPLRFHANTYNERKLVRFLKSLGKCRVRIFRGLGVKGFTTIDHVYLISKQR